MTPTSWCRHCFGPETLLGFWTLFWITGIELCLSEELLAELRDVLNRPRLAKYVQTRGLNSTWSCEFIQDRCLVISPSVQLEVPELRDRKGLHVLCAAQVAAVDYIITGDKDLLSLKSIAGIPIVDPAEAVSRLGFS